MPQDTQIPEDKKAEQIVTFIPTDTDLKLDVLFVIDDGHSSCEEIASLTSSYQAFLDTLKEHRSVVDLQVAVVSMRIEDEGKFQYRPLDEWPETCDLPHPPSCPSDGPTIMANPSPEEFGCLVRLGGGGPPDYGANLAQGLLMAWRALDLEGPNASQAKEFLRPDAFLLVMFLSDQDDCSVFPDFASPSFECVDDSDCGAGRCEFDPDYSAFFGADVSTCHGVIKKDYYSICSLLGEFRGSLTQKCAYDLTCSDCQSDLDCPEGFRCSQGGKFMKCRPACLEAGVSSYQSPAGIPLFSLFPLAELGVLYDSLKKDPNMLMVASVAGDVISSVPVDGFPELPAQCLEDPVCTPLCHSLAQNGCSSWSACSEDPSSEACEQCVSEVNECLRECYFFALAAGLTSETGPQTLAACQGPEGKAGLGSRFAHFVLQFGDRGLAGNLCKGVESEMARLAEFVLVRSGRVCLPVKVDGPDDLTVTLQSPGKDPIVLPAGTPDGYVLQESAAACCFPDSQGMCTGSQQAVVLNFLPDPSASVTIAVHGQP